MNAPWPREAVNSSPRKGASTTPATGVRSSRSATETPTLGKPRVKLVVPSRGSTAFLRENRDAGRLACEHLENGGLGPAIGRGHVVAATFELGRLSRVGKARLEQHRSSRARCAQGDGPKVAQSDLSSRPR